MTHYSFEFFPPKTPEGREKLINETAPALAALKPAYFSCTYGAGGSTREHTFEVVQRLIGQGLDVAPHLSFGGDDEEKMIALLQRYRDLGVRRIVALRGDMPSGMGAVRLVYGNELVAFIRKHFGQHFELEVAAYPEIHPQAVDFDTDIKYLKAKFDAGANTGITQYFYNADAYFYFMEQCRKIGITQPIYPGIMPITNFANLARFSANCGAEIPRWIVKKLESYRDDQASIRAFGLDVVTRLCETLIQGSCGGLHFYTMNSVEPTAELCRRLKLGQ